MTWLGGEETDSLGRSLRTHILSDREPTERAGRIVQRTDVDMTGASIVNNTSVQYSVSLEVHDPLDHSSKLCICSNTTFHGPPEATPRDDRDTRPAASPFAYRSSTTTNPPPSTLVAAPIGVDNQDAILLATCQLSSKTEMADPRSDQGRGQPQPTAKQIVRVPICAPPSLSPYPYASVHCCSAW